MRAVKLDLLYTEEHLGCPCYNPEGPHSLIDKIRLHYMQQYLRERSFPQIVVVYNGTIHLYLQCEEPFKVSEGHIFLLPAGVPARIRAQTESLILYFSLPEGLSLCPSFRLEELVCYVPTDVHTIHLLAVNPALSCYLGGLIPFLGSGLRCRRYLQVKISELLFCLRGYYSKEELAALLAVVLSDDFIFRDRVYACLRSNLKVGELAQQLGMSYASLISGFYRVFGTSPKEFIDNYKKEQLLHELKCGIKPLKTLPHEYGFSSYSAFTRFCISHLNVKPTEIRSKNSKLCGNKENG